ncbi:MAG: hypothetical protein JWQ78_2210 [Sediminibacterium sp.]|nr:hypothetical protein [Sediminibacterium sp.]
MPWCANFSLTKAQSHGWLLYTNSSKLFKLIHYRIFIARSDLDGWDKVCGRGDPVHPLKILYIAVIDPAQDYMPFYPPTYSIILWSIS